MGTHTRDRYVWSHMPAAAGSPSLCWEGLQHSPSPPQGNICLHCTESALVLELSLHTHTHTHTDV